MYHGISSGPLHVPPHRETGAWLYDVSLIDFKAQMQWLKDRVAFFPAILTFDDGELNNFDLVLPVLKGLGLKAYFFIIVSRVGKDGYMDWGHLRKLLDAGMMIGSHGLSHRILTRLSSLQIEEELRVSKQELEIHLKQEIDTLSIPRGYCNDKIIETAYRLGFKTIFISKRPPGLERFPNIMERVAVKSHWSLRRFDMALHGQRPITEPMTEISKNALKAIFHETGYEWARSKLIKL